MSGLGNLNQLMKMAQKMQQDVARVQEEMGEKTVEVSSGGGAVKVVVNGRKEVVSLTIDPQVLVPEEAEILEEMIIAAVNQGVRQAEEMMAQAIGKLTGGLKLPGLV
ncbi:MAG: YbaB/EbfC family nucleoid-associated protein [Bacillota bacterium]|nr:YbaB/EbfC family nucleoid-associated protein [Bacillota bacterium]